MTALFWAHSGSDDAARRDWQGLAEHLRSVARIAGERARPLGLEKAASCAGLLHDLGKYHPDFQRRLAGAAIQVDHSTAGGAILLQTATARDRIVAEALAYCILGHHAGLPDKTGGSDAALQSRVDSFRDGLDPAWRGEIAIDLAGIEAELFGRITPTPATAGFDLSVAVRMIFSCLVDADYRDTESYYASLEGGQVDRDWPPLQACLTAFAAAFDARIAALGDGSDINLLRRDVLEHVRGQAAMTPGLFTLTVPTGGGKTLASLGFALDHAARHGHRRIIYAIPFTSIIDQTAAIFRDILGDEHVLAHHSAIDEEKATAPEGRSKLRLAMEDWAAPVIVTTNVQFFESLFAARPSRARKLHNIAGSVVILDEAQMLPRPLLLPCLRMLDCLARHWGCSIVLCTATQPALDERRLAGGLRLAGRELAPDPPGLARRLRRNRIVDGGEMDNAALIAALHGEAQALVVVNSRAHALDLFTEAGTAGLEGLVHLTTRQYAAHRQEVLAEVRRRLRAGEPCRVIATSLIEAGVDVDFPRVWRAKAGLDQIVQAAGRCNREGLRPAEASIVTVFTDGRYPPPRAISQLSGDMARMWEDHRDDLLSLGAMEAYFGEVYWRLGSEGLDRKRLLSRFSLTRSHGTDFAFRSVAADFRMIESAMVPVVIPLGDAAEVVGRLGVPELSSGRLARDLQRYIVLVPPNSRQKLIDNGKAYFGSPDLRGDQFAVLADLSLYHEDSGLWWHDAEYLATESIII